MVGQQSADIADTQQLRTVAMTTVNHFLVFYVWGTHWRHLENSTEQSMCDSNAALCQITSTICYTLVSLCDTWDSI